MSDLIRRIEKLEEIILHLVEMSSDISQCMKINSEVNTATLNVLKEIKDRIEDISNEEELESDTYFNNHTHNEESDLESRLINGPDHLQRLGQIKIFPDFLYSETTN